MSPIGQLLLSGRLGEATIGHLIKLSRPLSRFFHALSSPETSAWPVDTRYAAVPRLAGTEGQVRFLPSHSPATSSLLACHPSVPFFSFSLTDVSRFLTGWVHGCSILFWFLKVALSSHKHTTPLAPSAFQVSLVLSLFKLFTPLHIWHCWRVLVLGLQVAGKESTCVFSTAEACQRSSTTFDYVVVHRSCLHPKVIYAPGISATWVLSRTCALAALSYYPCSFTTNPSLSLQHFALVEPWPGRARSTARRTPGSHPLVRAPTWSAIPSTSSLPMVQLSIFCYPLEIIPCSHPHTAILVQIPAPLPLRFPPVAPPLAHPSLDRSCLLALQRPALLSLFLAHELLNFETETFWRHRLLSCLVNHIWRSGIATPPCSLPPVFFAVVRENRVALSSLPLRA